MLYTSDLYIISNIYYENIILIIGVIHTYCIHTCIHTCTHTYIYSIIIIITRPCRSQLLSARHSKLHSCLIVYLFVHRNIRSVYPRSTQPSVQLQRLRPYQTVPGGPR